MPLTYRELEVMDRHDRGMTASAIARELKINRARAVGIIERYRVSIKAEARAEDALRAQTARLGELVRQAGGHR